MLKLVMKLMTAYDISIVTSQYHFDETLKGQIAVIGPTAIIIKMSFNY